ncbi:MAG: M42 family metallopeptidase [Aeropyrum sp.]|nr:M42 family metallopeptidase [Aeropyrum sp.]
MGGNIIEDLKRLVFTPGPSGFEDLVRELVVKRLEDLGFSPKVDELGNVLLLPGGGSVELLLAAHMDELGFVITGISDDGLLSFRKLGGIDDRILPGQHVMLILDDGSLVDGVIGLTPPHLQLDRSEQDRAPRWYELKIDVGASSREEAEAMGIRPLTPAVFKKHWSTLGQGNIVASRGFDDRVGVALLLEIARKISEGSVSGEGVALAWTVQEEVGLRGAFYVGSKINASTVIAVDTMACCHPAITGSAKPGRGPIIRALDNQHITPRWLVKSIVQSASNAGVKVQFASAGGTTDAAAFQRAGIPSAAVGIPLKYTHTTAEMLHIRDALEALKLLEGVIDSIPKGAIA